MLFTLDEHLLSIYYMLGAIQDILDCLMERVESKYKSRIQNIMYIDLHFFEGKECVLLLL